MIALDEQFCSFLVRAKRNTYAGHGVEMAPSRPASHDLHYREGELLYIDTYLGGYDFAGEEAVWQKDKAIWAMNYYGQLLAAEFPPGFNEFLKDALRAVPLEAPYRGPPLYQDGDLLYQCNWQGVVEEFSGQEMIEYQHATIYKLLFHGGAIR